MITNKAEAKAHLCPYIKTKTGAKDVETFTNIRRERTKYSIMPLSLKDPATTSKIIRRIIYTICDNAYVSYFFLKLVR